MIWPFQAIPSQATDNPLQAMTWGWQNWWRFPTQEWSQLLPWRWPGLQADSEEHVANLEARNLGHLPPPKKDLYIYILKSIKRTWIWRPAAWVLAIAYIIYIYIWVWFSMVFQCYFTFTFSAVPRSLLWRRLDDAFECIQYMWPQHGRANKHRHTHGQIHSIFFWAKQSHVYFMWCLTKSLSHCGGDDDDDDDDDDEDDEDDDDDDDVDDDDNTYLC